MWMKRGVWVVTLAVFAAGCGSGDGTPAADSAAAEGSGPASAPAGAPPARAAGAGGSAAAAAAATDTRRCPPELSTPEPAEGAPVDDILGVRPGQTFAEVEAILACREEDYQVEPGAVWSVRNTHGQPTRQLIRATNGVPCTGQDIARSMRSMQGDGECSSGPRDSRLSMVRNATDEVWVVFTGLHGEEVAGAVWRTRDYPADAQPTAESLQQALITKYGEPSVAETLTRNSLPLRSGDVALTWVYDLRGRKLSSENPMYRRCSNVNHNFFGSHRWSGECGLMVTAGIRKNPRNNLLVNTMTIGIMNQKDFYDRSQTFESTLAALAEEQRQQAARDAAAVQTDL